MSQLISCPECKKHLQVPDELMGKKVQCPECRHTFIAAESTPTEVVSSTSTTASKPKAKTSSGPTKKAPAWDTDDDDDDDDDDDSRSRKSKPPRKKRRDDDDDDDDDVDDDDDDDDRPRRRRRRRRSSYGGGGYMPHRGGMIMAFGIISLVSFLVFPLASVIFGPMAWSMGNSDMAEIRAGRMDPSGEGMIQTGRIMGIFSTIVCILGVIGLFGCCCLGMIQQPPR